ncbi:MAG: NAD-dependent epimerase/dehydratase family protein [Pirellulales bacterium]
MRLLIVGCGYVGKALAEHFLRYSLSKNGSSPSENSRSPLANNELSICALTRSEANANVLRSCGINAHVGHWLDRSSLPELEQSFTHLLVAVPHRADSGCNLDESSDQFHVQGLINLRDWLSGGRFDIAKPNNDLPKLVYLSTTGVYGQTGAGETVNECTPVEPNRVGPRIAVAAERWLLTNSDEWPSTVLRLAGIYGPGRIPLLEKLRSNEPLAVPSVGRLNLIHLDDIVAAIIWALRSPSAESLYVLSDRAPVLRQEFYSYLAKLHGLALPQFVEPAADDNRLKRSSDKIVDSTKFWKQSGLTPIHPDYTSGLAKSG